MHEANCKCFWWLHANLPANIGQFYWFNVFNPANLSNPANPFNPASLSNPANPSSLQITNLLLARGAGGRGEALRIRPHPAGCEGRANSTDAVPQFPQVLESQGGPPLPPAPPKSDPKINQKSNQTKVQNFDPKWPSKGTLKNSKISPNLQNGTLKHLSRALLAAFISERVPKPSPRTSRTSKIIVLPS